MSTKMNAVFSDNEPDPSRVAFLLAGFINETLTEAEHDELDDWVGASDDNMRLFGELTDEQNIQTSLAKLRAIDTDSAYADLLLRIGADEKKTKSTISFKTILAFAATLILIVVIALVYQSKKDNSAPDKPGEHLVQDIAPGGTHATLIVAGVQRELAAGNTGLWFTSDSARIEQRNEGVIRYSPGVLSNKKQQHILSTPKGGQYSVVLQDGTRVWLNAESQLSYPSQFDSSVRLVQLRGEAYFEVNTVLEQQTKKPFVVQVDDMKVTVTGTRFNINAYENEPVISTTLLEGVVAVSSGAGSSRPLVPGEQALYLHHKTEIHQLAAAEQVIAWKEGVFKFENASIETIMRQVERWYNSTVVYKGTVGAQFNATVNKNVPVSKLLHYLELTGHVKFEIKGNSIEVYPQ